MLQSDNLDKPISPHQHPLPQDPQTENRLRCPSLQPPLLPPIPFSPPPTNGDGDRETPGRRRRAFPQMIKAGPLSILSDLGDLHPQVLLIPEIKTKTELFLDLVAEAQSKRLEGQRATFHIPSGSLATTSVRVQVSEDRDQLYSTILSHQCQRIEAQRSDPPLPPGGQELLELLLRVQGNGRMEEQRSRPPSHTC
ncbi:G-protein-signaling modulator 3 isoform X3 [Sarcophilus harrisii]|uniref:G-protein-signaling modulator 3 isoform X3 n=1 Tax=Sarcophilus harrisii TaxID=9305 RepID=UPI001301F167|nr:G-protein-signaling modulator 3 isoform X3 [Sarcophilus harrisii]